MQLCHLNFAENSEKTKLVCFLSITLNCKLSPKLWIV